MNNNQKKILEMLSIGKISVAEAERLLSLTQSEEPETENKAPKKTPKYLRVLITAREDNPDSTHRDNVNVRVPMALLRAGIKLASIIPPGAYNELDSALKNKGVQFDLRDLKPENIEELIESLGELEVNVEDADNRVRVFAE